jgi:cytochrome oxidase Cu insertion factor (SCO1/SenC/PrrC family)
MKIRNFYIAICCVALSIPAAAQNKQYSEKDYSREPVWIQMLDDTTANFFEVEKAFDTYFKAHELPKSEHDMIGEYSERQKKLSKRQQKKVEDDSYLSRHEKMLPYVQPDGRILTPSERLAIWQQIKDENNKK